MLGIILMVGWAIRQNCAESVLFCSVRENGISIRFHEKKNQNYCKQVCHE